MLQSLPGNSSVMYIYVLCYFLNFHSLEEPMMRLITPRVLSHYHNVGVIYSFRNMSCYSHTRKVLSKEYVYIIASTNMWNVCNFKRRCKDIDNSCTMISLSLTFFFLIKIYLCFHNSAGFTHYYYYFCKISS